MEQLSALTEEPGVPESTDATAAVFAVLEAPSEAASQLLDVEAEKFFPPALDVATEKCFLQSPPRLRIWLTRLRLACTCRLLCISHSEPETKLAPPVLGRSSCHFCFHE